MIVRREIGYVALVAYCPEVKRCMWSAYFCHQLAGREMPKQNPPDDTTLVGSVPDKQHLEPSFLVVILRRSCSHGKPTMIVGLRSSFAGQSSVRSLRRNCNNQLYRAVPPLPSGHLGIIVVIDCCSILHIALMNTTEDNQRPPILDGGQGRDCFEDRTDGIEVDVRITTLKQA